MATRFTSECKLARGRPQRAAPTVAPCKAFILLTQSPDEDVNTTVSYTPNQSGESDLSSSR